MIHAVICDDEQATHKIIRYYLTREKLPVEIVGDASNGREAREIIDRLKPDLIFMDVQMPYMTGFDVVREMKKGRVIIITAYASFEYAQQALRLGVSDILSKPIDFEQLNKAIDRAVGGRYTENDTVNQILAYLYEHFQKVIGTTPAGYLRRRT